MICAVPEGQAGSVELKPAVHGAGTASMPKAREVCRSSATEITSAEIVVTEIATKVRAK